MKNIWIILFLGVFGMAQSPIETARKSLKAATTATDSIKAYQDLAWYCQTIYLDSSFYYNEKAQEIIDRVGDKNAANTNLKERAGYIYRSGKYKDAEELYLKVQAQYATLHDSLNVAKISSNLGAVYQTASQPKKAMQEYIKALKFFESDSKYAQVTAQTLMNLGVLYKSVGNQEEALEFYLRSEKILDKGNNLIAKGNIKMNLGSLYVDLDQDEKAKNYLEQSRELALKSNNYTTLAAVDQNLGVIATKEERFNDAIAYFEESLSIKEQLGDLNEAATSRVSLAVVQTEKEQYNAALKNLRAAIKVFEKNDNKERLLIAYPAINAVYIYTSQQDSAFVYLDKYTKLRADIDKENAAQITSELDKKYQSEKKDRELAEQKSAILSKELEVKKRDMMLWILGLILLTAILLGFLFYRQQKLKNLQLQQENLLKEAKAKIETQNRLQEQRLRISRDLHDNIGSQLTFLISSLDSLKYAQNVDKGIANEKLGQLSSFTRSTIGELRDTIWAMNHDQISIEDLRNRLTTYISKARESGVSEEIELELTQTVDLERSFNSVVGMNIFRVLQESINNAIKYAQCDQINVLINQEKDKLLVSIKDNGKGFDPVTNIENNGLRNMRERIAQSEGSLNIISSSGNGTEVVFEVPFK